MGEHGTVSECAARPRCKLVAVCKLWLTAFVEEAWQLSSTFVLSPSKVFQRLQQDHNGMFQLLIGGPLQVSHSCVS